MQIQTKLKYLLSASQLLSKLEIMLRAMFTTYGLPVMLYFENGRTFTSSKFEKFIRANSVTHCGIPPHHPVKL